MLPAHRRSFAPKWQRSIEEGELQAATTKETTERYYNATAQSLPQIHIRSNVAVQNPKTKLWDTYGRVTMIGPHRQYHVITIKGQVLVRNRRFLRRRTPTSMPEGIPSIPPTTGQAVTSQPSTAELQPARKSSRTRKLTQRLLEDPTWN